MGVPSDPGDTTNGGYLFAGWLNAVRAMAWWAATGSPYGDVTTWTDWTPVVRQGGTTLTASSTTRSRWQRHGDLVVVHCRFTNSTAGTAGQPILCSLPYKMSHTEDCHGTFSYFDSGTTIYTGVAWPSAFDQIRFLTQSGSGGIGADPSFAAASGDLLRFTFSYRAVDANPLYTGVLEAATPGWYTEDIEDGKKDYLG